MSEQKKVYLGDGVSVEVLDGTLALTTGDGTAAMKTIRLRRGVYVLLMQFAHTEFFCLANDKR